MKKCPTSTVPCKQIYRGMEKFLKMGLVVDKNIVQKCHVLTAGNTAFPHKEI
jgi:hypothetical protein